MEIIGLSTDLIPKVSPYKDIVLFGNSLLPFPPLPLPPLLFLGG